MGLIYLDTCVLIYLVEGNNDFGESLKAKFAENSDTIYCFSPLGIAECLVGPIKAQNSDLLRAYEDFFEYLICFELNDIVFRNAATLRAESGLKLADAIHLACAEYFGCDGLWTNDQRLARAQTSVEVQTI